MNENLVCVELEDIKNIYGGYDCQTWEQLELDFNQNSGSDVFFITPEYVGILIVYALIINIFSAFVRLVTRDMFNK